MRAIIISLVTHLLAGLPIAGIILGVCQGTGILEDPNNWHLAGLAVTVAGAIYIKGRD